MVQLAELKKKPLFQLGFSLILSAIGFLILNCIWYAPGLNGINGAREYMSHEAWIVLSAAISGLYLLWAYFINFRRERIPIDEWERDNIRSK
jgi:succinate dehydrogenase/fumarate reductase cytochrome b subunit